MAQYASKSPRDLNHDPMPYVSYSGNRYAENLSPAVWKTEPRPEFDPPKAHNEPNPILVAFRDREAAGNPYAVRQWLAFLTAWDGTICPATPSQIDHARKVLSRLSRRQS